MKKAILTALFIAVAMTLGFSSTPQVSEEKAAVETKRAYNIVPLHIGDVVVTSHEMIISINFSGSYSGCSANFLRLDDGRFLWRDASDAPKGNNIYIGNVAVNGGQIVYEILANVK